MASVAPTAVPRRRDRGRSRCLVVAFAALVALAGFGPPTHGAPLGPAPHRAVADAEAFPGHPGFVVPDLDLEDFHGLPIEDEAELRGMLLLVYEVPVHGPGEPISYTTGSRIQRMGRYAESFGSRGLVVLAVMDADAGEEQRVARETTIRTAFCRYGSKRGRDDAREALGRTLPDGVLIDPLGVLVDVDGIGPDDIQAYLDGAFDVPPWTWPTAGHKLARKLREGELGPAWSEAVARGDDLGDLGDLAAIVLDQGRQALAASERAWLEGDVLTAWLRTRRLTDLLQGTPLEKSARTLRDQVQSDPRGGELRRVQLRVRELVNDTPPEARAAERILPELQEIAEQHRDTRAGREARFWHRFYADIARGS